MEHFKGMYVTAIEEFHSLFLSEKEKLTYQSCIISLLYMIKLI